MVMLRGIGIHISSVRLDKYYIYPGISKVFGDAWIYIIPKRNDPLRGS